MVEPTPPTCKLWQGNVLATKRFGGKVAKPKSETGRMAGQLAVCTTALTVEKSLEVQAKVNGGNIDGGGQEREGKGGGDVPPREKRKFLASLPAERKALKGRKAS